MSTRSTSSSLLSAVFGSSSNDDEKANSGLFSTKITPKAKITTKSVEKEEVLKEKLDVDADEDVESNAAIDAGVGSQRVKGGKKRMRAVAAAAALKDKDVKAVIVVDQDQKNKKQKEDVANIVISDSAATSPNQTKTLQGGKEGETADKDDANHTNTASANVKNERTIFVGNLPLPTSHARKLLTSLFAPCGAIESTRVRSVAVQGVKLPEHSAGNQNMMRKVCANTNLVDDAVKQTVNGYIVFEEIGSVEKALLLNNAVVHGENGDGKDMHIRVDTATPTLDSARSVFVGNLPFKANEEDIRNHFVNSLDGIDVENVRVVRDNETQQCKGIAYVLFKSKDMVADALRLNGTTCCKRPIRVQVCGKRYKGNRGHEKASKGSDDYSGRRATEGASKRILSKLKSKNLISTKSTILPKKRRARGEKPKTGIAPGKKIGMSRRATSEAKVNKRTKKIEKRIRDGMGKNKR